jgi:hypothetical protein
MLLPRISFHGARLHDGGSNPPERVRVSGTQPRARRWLLSLPVSPVGKHRARDTVRLSHPREASRVHAETDNTGAV